MEKILENKKTIVYILVVAFILRIIWIFAIKTQPISDFKLMYETGRAVANGNFSGFHGNSYFARFPHDSITVLYFASLFKISSTPLILIKILNCIYETISVYLIYRIGIKISNYKLGNIIAALLCIFPPFIFYTSETMAENMAIPLFLGSVLLFLGFINNKKIKPLIYSGILLSLGDLFRPVGIVFLIAYIIYYILDLIIYKKEKIKKSIVKIITLIIVFILPTVVVSNLLVYNKILQNQIWKPLEPTIITILVGTNYNTIGAWNAPDASLAENNNYNKEAISKIVKKEMTERFEEHTPVDILEFYAKKLVLQWGFGDFGACGWTINYNKWMQGSTQITNTKNIIDEGISIFENNIVASLLMIVSWIYYFILLFFSVKGIMALKRKFNLAIVFFIILLLGFIGFYLLTERQSRYAFIIAWDFVILAGYGMLDKINNKKYSH
ncbi:glycosyltransferase family 39 protein [uncultured Clostridium sp.]|uniref:glycosyltransferase family 39 protein n=1 Tax=uncultured Clostridium sp. TaxID=59620 RepID=UPI00261524E6|nr:glycosyltransferase family 39 protein [uncultured Clostridium sp.]